MSPIKLCCECELPAKEGRVRCYFHAERMKNYQRKSLLNPENRKRHDERRRAWQKAKPDHLWAYSIKKKFGVTPEMYSSMLSKQGGACAICGTKEPSGTAGKHGRFHIDHDHASKKIRGLLCNNCNLGIGYFKDDKARLLAAAEYIRQTGVDVPN